MIATTTVVVGALLAGGSAPAPVPQSAYGLLWATSDSVRAAAAKAVIETGAPFDSVLSGIRRGPNYASSVPVGRLDRLRTAADGARFPYTVLVPMDYEPNRRYPVRVYLHGGVSRAAWPAGGAWWRDYTPFERSDVIGVFPAAWDDAPWWSPRQIDNLTQILHAVAREYNVDENRIAMVGISDGASGAFYHAFRAPARWATFLPFIGHPAILSNPRLVPRGDMFVPNLRNRPLFIVNGARDRLYPAESVAEFIDLFRREGVEVTFTSKASGHDVRWWPAEAARIDSFIAAHPRDPHPRRIVWETDRTDGERLQWVIVDELDEASDADDGDANTLFARSAVPVLGALPEDREGGPALTYVEDGSVADQAGLRVDDVIVAVGDIPTPTSAALAAAMRGIAHGARTPIVYRRAGRRHDAILPFPVAPPLTRMQAFRRSGRSGRIEAVRDGNTITVRADAVRRYRVLISPDVFDFDRPIRIETNGVTSFHDRVNPRVETLVTWAARDRDRTMLYGVEIEIEVRSGG